MIPKIIFNRGKKDWIKRPLLSNIEKIIDYRGRTPKKLGLNWSDTGYLALSALNVKNGYIDFKADANYGNQELYDRWMGDKHLHKGQVVFTTEAPMGNVAQIPNDDLYILSQRTIAFEVKHDLIREDFLATLLRSPKIFNELTSLSSGGTAKGVSQKSLSNLKVCVPATLEEQSAIGSLFRTLDDLLASYKNNLANYQSLKVTMLSKMFPKDGQTVPEIRLDGFEGEWKIIKLGDVLSELKSGLSRELSNDDIGLPVIRANNISDGNLNLDSDIKYWFKEDPKGANTANYVVRENDILVNFINSEAKMGTAAIVLSEPDRETIYTTNILKLTVKEDYYPYFIYLMTLLQSYQYYIKAITKPAVNQASFTTVDFKKYEFLCPAFQEQQAIGSYFSNLDNLINSHKEKISQLETLKKKLLQDMFV